MTATPPVLPGDLQQACATAVMRFDPAKRL